MGLGQP